jgi:hypothetical protein
MDYDTSCALEDALDDMTDEERAAVRGFRADGTDNPFREALSQ